MKRTGSRKTRSRKYMPLVRIFLAVSILMMAILVTEYEVQRLQAKNTAKAVTESVEVEPTRTSAEGAARILTGETIKAVVKSDSSNSTYKAGNLLKNDSTKADYKITVFENTKKLYSNDRVNVRSGAGTDYDRLGVIKRDTGIEVHGITDNGWYQVMYKDEVGYVRKDLLQEEEPGVEYIFAGDSRTVQMSQAVKNSDYEWIAKVGEGYTFFSNEAVPQIDASAGDGSVIIINYGVNDLHNAEKYIKLINKKIDSWISAGATVYYAAVTPVSDYPTITNDDIEKFNSEMKEGLDSRVGWLDGYTYLQNNGFSTGDGLHYNETTYKSLYTYYVNQVAANKEAA